MPPNVALSKEYTVFFLRRKKSSHASLPSASSETIQETMQRRANEYISTLQRHYPREFARLHSEVEQGCSSAHCRV